MQPTVKSSMIATMIPNFDRERAKLREIATSGFVLGLGMSWQGPEHLHSEFPEEWRNLYERENLYVGDPVLLWHIVNTGFRRWSEIRLPDAVGVMKKARTFGLNYGAVFAQKSDGGRCFLSVARDDRELENSELEQIDAKFRVWVDLIMDRSVLTPGELDILRAFRDGFAQRETAEMFGISESAVKQRAIKACSKLNARTRTQAVAIAVARNYLE